MSDDEPTLPFIRAKFGDADEYYHLRYPRLNADGTVYLWAEDGTKVLTFPVRGALHYYQAFPTGVTLAHSLNSIRPEKNTTILHKLEVLITDSRIIVHSPEPKYPGQRLVAHLWYPWIAEIGYRPKQSFWNEAAINLGYRQDFPLVDRGTWWQRLELVFDKDFHPRELAREIVRRLSAHHLRHGVPAAAEAVSRELLQPDILPDPPKGEFASYYTPAYVAWPGGVTYIETKDKVAWEWTVTTASGAAEAIVSESNEPTPDGAAAAAPPASSFPSSGHLDVDSYDSHDSERETGRFPRLGLRDRLSLAKEVVVAQRAYDADRHQEAADAYDRILAKVFTTTSGLNSDQVVDLLGHAVDAHSALGHTDEAVTRCEEALSLAVKQHNESMELSTRGHLARALAKAPKYEQFAPNLRRICELSDALCSREERAGTYFSIAAEFRDSEYFDDACHAYEAAAELRNSLGDHKRAGLAIAWQSHVLRRLGRHRDADAAWDRSQELLKDFTLSSSQRDERLPTMFDLYDPAARRAVVLARDESAELSRIEIGADALLLGVATTECATQAMLADAGATADQIRDQLRSTSHGGLSHQGASTLIPFNQAARVAFEKAYGYVIEFSNGQLSTGHLLLGAMQNDAVHDVLQNLGVDHDALREQVYAALRA